jgi:hypothetical protein
MTDKRAQAQADQSNMEKRPEDRLTKAEASRRIDERQKRTGHGLGRSSAKSAEQQARESGDGEADAHGGDVRGVKDR